MGWIYEYHDKGLLRTDDERFFSHCIYELPIGFMISNGYLTPPVLIDSPVACYDFSSLELNDKGQHSAPEIDNILQDQSRITPSIVAHIVDLSEGRAGVMVFYINSKTR